MVVIVVVALSILLYPSASAFAQTVSGGLVPCGTGTTACTLCDFIIGFHNLLDFFRKLIIMVALGGITIAGVMYVISNGDETAMKTAKEFMTASVVGFAIVIGAWLIINVTMWLMADKLSLAIGKNWYEFNCSAFK